MIRHKLSPIFLVSLAIITLISSVAASIGIAHAASSVLLYSDMDTNQKIISYEFYKSLSSCVDDTDYSATRKSIFTVSDSILNNAKSVMGIGSAAEIDAEIVKTPTTSNTDIFVQIFNHSKTNGYNIGLQAEATAKKNGAKVGDSTNGIVSCEEIAKAAYGESRDGS